MELTDIIIKTDEDHDYLYELCSKYQYRKQQAELEKIHPGISELDLLKRNDYVIYLGGLKARHLTKGKEYRLIRDVGYLTREDKGIGVENDKGSGCNYKAMYFRKA